MSKPHEEWLDRAEDDIKFAEIGLKERFYSQVCFLSQQAVEKSLKGALVASGKGYPKSHSLHELTQRIPGIKLEHLKDKIAVLDGYYVPIRYPDAAPGMKSSGPPSMEEAEDALLMAKEVFEIVVQYIHNPR